MAKERAKPTNIFVKQATQRVDFEEAVIKIYRAFYPLPEPTLENPEPEPHPLDGKRVIKVVAQGLPTHVEELPPALDALIDQVLSRYAGEHGLSKGGE